MMEELQDVIKAIAGLPQIALWVIILFWAYKTFIIGSVYAVIRFSVSKAVEWGKLREANKLERDKLPVIKPVYYDTASFMLDEQAWEQVKSELFRIALDVKATYRPSSPLASLMNSRTVFDRNCVEWLKSACEAKRMGDTK